MKISDVEGENFRILSEMKESLRQVQEDITRIKTSLVKDLPQDESLNVFQIECLDTVETFEAFAEKVLAKPFERLVVRSYRLINVSMQSN